MGERLKFDYYYGNEAEQFSFYRVPRILIKDKRFSGMSSDAKILYGLMLDRMSLSMKNGWMDEENRAYIIYKVEEAAEDLGISKPTAGKVMAELDVKTGIGLIEKKRFGLGKPDIIYVKNFIGVEIIPAEPAEETAKDTSANTLEDTLEDTGRETAEETSGKAADKAAEAGAGGAGNPDNSTEVKNFNFKNSKNLTSGSKEILLQEVKDFNSRKSNHFTSGGKESLPPEVKNFYPNYTEYSQTEESYTDSIHPSFFSGEDGASPNAGHEDGGKEGGTEKDNLSPDDICFAGMPGYLGGEDYEEDGEDDGAEARYVLCEHLVRCNISYDELCRNNPHQTDIIDEIVRLMTDVISVDRKRIRVNNALYPYKTVRNVFLKIGGEHIEYVLESLRQHPVKISNIRNYLITLLYNSYLTFHNSLSAQVNYDMNGGGWVEKGIIK